MADGGLRGLTRVDLDKMNCNAPGCTHDRHDAATLQMFVLHARCHKESPTTAYYFADGSLDVHCKRCDAFVARIAIAPADVERLAPRLACDHAGCTDPPEKHFVALKAATGNQRGVLVSYAAGKLVIVDASRKRLVETLQVREAPP